MDFPKGKLIHLAGANSNGKSVCVKITKDLISGALRRPRARAALINKTAQCCEAEYVRDDGTVLLVHVTREASGTYITYKEPDSEPIQRYLSDKSFDSFVERFGWHYMPDRDISLNISEGSDKILFLNTSPKVNLEVLETALTDQHATAAAERIDAVLKNAKQYKAQAVMRIQATHQAVANVKLYDTEDLENKKVTMMKLRHNLESFYIPTIPAITPVPNVKFIDIHLPKVPRVKYPPICTIQVNIPDITQIAREIKSLKENKCPTCGREF